MLMLIKIALNAECGICAIYLLDHDSIMFHSPYFRKYPV